jgi:hypothetical protein
MGSDCRGSSAQLPFVRIKVLAWPNQRSASFRAIASPKRLFGGLETPLSFVYLAASK